MGRHGESIVKVVFKKKVSEQILDRKREANLGCKEIEYIMLTEDEAKSLLGESGVGHMYPFFAKPHHLHGTTLYGVKLRVEGL